MIPITTPSQPQFLIVNEEQLIIRLPQSSYSEGFFKFLNKDYLQLSKQILRSFYEPKEDFAAPQSITPKPLTKPLSPDTQQQFHDTIDKILDSIFSMNNSYSTNFDWPVITGNKFEHADILKRSYDSYLYTIPQVQQTQEFLHKSFNQYDQLIMEWSCFFDLLENNHLENSFLAALSEKNEFTTERQMDKNKLYLDLKSAFLNPLDKHEASQFSFWREKFTGNPNYLLDLPRILLGEQPFIESLALIEKLPPLEKIEECYVPALITHKTCILRFLAEDYKSGYIQATFNFQHCLGIFMNKKTAQNVCMPKYQTKKFNLTSTSLVADNALGILEYRHGHLTAIHVLEDEDLNAKLYILFEQQQLFKLVQTPANTNTTDTDITSIEQLGKFEKILKKHKI